MERTIKVTGRGKVSVKPDRIRLVITQTDTRREHSETMEASAENKMVLNRVMELVGLEKSELKTLSFHVDTAYESYQEKNAWKRRMMVIHTAIE